MYNNTPLILLSQNDLEMKAIQLATIKDINYTNVNKRDDTILHWSIFKQQNDLTRTILNICDDNQFLTRIGADKRTPLGMAFQYNIDMAQPILDKMIELTCDFSNNDIKLIVNYSMIDSIAKLINKKFVSVNKLPEITNKNTFFELLFKLDSKYRMSYINQQTKFKLYIELLKYKQLDKQMEILKKNVKKFNEKNDNTKDNTNNNNTICKSCNEDAEKARKVRNIISLNCHHVMKCCMITDHIPNQCPFCETKITEYKSCYVVE